MCLFQLAPVSHSVGGDDIEIVHADSSACVATTDAPSLEGMMVLPAYLVMTLLIFSLLVSLGKYLYLSL
jgi:hypothetical protein